MKDNNVDETPKEIYKAFEDVMTRNLQMVVQHSNETRKLLKDVENKVHHLEKTIIQKDEVIANLKQQLASVQQRLWQ